MANDKITDKNAVKVTGGGDGLGEWTDPNPGYHPITVLYRDYQYGEIKTTSILIADGSSSVAAAKEWCDANGKIYADWM